MNKALKTPGFTGTHDDRSTEPTTHRTAGKRKERPFADGVADRSNRPKATHAAPAGLCAKQPTSACGAPLWVKMLTRVTSDACSRRIARTPPMLFSWQRFSGGPTDGRRPIHRPAPKAGFDANHLRPDSAETGAIGAQGCLVLNGGAAVGG